MKRSKQRGMRGKKDSGNMKKEGREKAEGKICVRKGKKRKKDIVKKKNGGKSVV
jgi:hypothetical protein